MAGEVMSCGTRRTVQTSRSCRGRGRGGGGGGICRRTQRRNRLSGVCKSHSSDLKNRREILKQFLLSTSLPGLLDFHDAIAARAEEPSSASQVSRDDFNFNSNKVIVVTGAGKGGIGYSIARQLASRGYTIVPVCRSLMKAESTCRALSQDVLDAQVCPLVSAPEGCDLSSIRAVLQYSKRLNEALYQQGSEDGKLVGKDLYAIVNNAGVGWITETFTEDGYEKQFAVNHLSHFLLTTELIKAKLSHTANLSHGTRRSDVEKLRVINLSSSAHYAGFINPAGIIRMNGESRSYNRFGAYCDSKLANILFTKELGYKYGQQGIVSSAVHPGIVNTKLIRNLVPEWVMEDKERHPERDRLLAKYIGLRSPDDGALGAVWLATEANSMKMQGNYYNGPNDERVPARQVTDMQLSQSLWAASEVLILKALNKSIPDDLLEIAFAKDVEYEGLSSFSNLSSAGPEAGAANLARMLLTNFK